MRLQVALNKKTAPTHVALLSSLEPVVAHRYRSVLTDSRLTAIEKFKKAEHITEEQALTSSSNALPQLLVSREIPGIVELQAALWSGKFGPDQALQELKWVQEQHTNLEQIFKDLGKSKIQDLKVLPASLLEKWLQEADLTKLSGPQQKVLLEAIQDQALTYVFLKNSRVMTGSWLLYFKLDQIKKLDLSGCKNLGSLSSGILGDAPVLMPALTHLKLDETGVSAIVLEAVELKKLMARNCRQLKSLKLTVPALNKLVLEGSAILDNPTYLYEQGIKQDNKQSRKLAFHYYKQAADQGHALAQYQVGWMYEHGRGVGQDASKAAVYYGKAAEQGHIGAQWNLGSMYAAGRGIEKDERKAQIWIEKADAEVRKWPRSWILEEMQNKSDELDLEHYYGSLSIEQVGILSQHPCFKQKRLKFGEISSSGIRKLAQVLPATQLHTLNLSNSALSNNKIGAEGATKLAQALPATQIHTLYLSFNKIGAEGAIKLAEVLPATQIHTLYLSSNNIGAEGAIKLVQALPSTQIHTLDLGLNQIGDKGTTKLAQALPSTQIHTLDLGFNKIGDEGAIKLAEVLPATQIHTLDLSYNKIGDEGAIKLAEVLPATQIHTLKLWENNIGAEGAIRLAEVLSSTKIYTLDLSNNKIGAGMEKKLKTQFPKIKFNVNE